MCGNREVQRRPAADNSLISDHARSDRLAGALRPELVEAHHIRHGNHAASHPGSHPRALPQRRIAADVRTFGGWCSAISVTPGWLALGPNWGQGFETQVREGILWVRSEFRMLGYLNAPSAFDDDGWFNTQDRVEVDGDWFKILGRVTDLINVAGQKVYPAEVEDVILQLPNVTDVVVKGEKHTLLGQIVVAHVALTEPEPLSELRARVRSACLSKLADYKVPAKVVLMEAEMYSARFKKFADRRRDYDSFHLRLARSRRARANSRTGASINVFIRETLSGP